MRRHRLLFITLYCAAFIWLAMPFVMVDDSFLQSPDIQGVYKTQAITHDPIIMANAEQAVRH
jgi:hypothetical protein